MSRAGPVSRTALVYRDDFQAGITLGEPAQLIGWWLMRWTVGKPEWAWFCTLVGLMSWAGLVNMITWKNLSPASRDPGTVILRSRLTGLAWLSCNPGVLENFENQGVLNKWSLFSCIFYTSNWFCLLNATVHLLTGVSCFQSFTKMVRYAFTFSWIQYLLHWLLALLIEVQYKTEL